MFRKSSLLETHALKKNETDRYTSTVVLFALAVLHPRRVLPQSFAQLRLDKKALPQPPFSEATPPMQVEEGIEYLPVYTAELHNESTPNELPNRMSRAELSAQRRSNTEI